MTFSPIRRPYLDALPEEAPLMSATFSAAQVAAMSLVPGHYSKLVGAQNEANALISFLMEVMAAYPSVFGQPQEDWRDLAIWSYATLSTRMYDGCPYAFRVFVAVLLSFRGCCRYGPRFSGDGGA
jgi:hypothetical protein